LRQTSRRADFGVTRLTYALVSVLDFLIDKFKKLPPAQLTKDIFTRHAALLCST
jgi:hypothetical protein